MVVIQCPAEERCSGLRLGADLDPVEVAAQVCDHLEGHHVHGQTLIGQLAAIRVDSDGPQLELLRRIDRPLIAENGGTRHAIRPGLVSLDGRGPALCVDWSTVRIISLPIFGGPARATARPDPGTVKPTCRSCCRRLR